MNTPHIQQLPAAPHTENDTLQAKLEQLRTVIHEHVITYGTEQKIVTPHGTENKEGWLLDFRNIIMNSRYMNLLAEIFWEKYENQYPFQVGGQEIAAIPLVCAIALKGEQRGQPVNGFFTRKSKKKTGLQKVIEGKLNSEKIILVDDLMNSGSTQLRQINALEVEGVSVAEIFVIVLFRDLDHYQFAHERDIRISHLFTPEDLGLQQKEKKRIEPPLTSNFDIEWKFESTDPNMFYVVPKSRPIIDESKIYFGSDNGTFWALNQRDGSIAWKHKIWRKAANKAIFSSPALYKDTVYYGAYDGNVYAIDTTNGRVRWTFWEADWIGSSPALAPRLNTLFIGLEFGLFSRRGGIAALDMKTGEKKWEYSMSGLTHASPAYSQKYRVVGCGCNNNTFYLFDAKTGELLWEREVGGEIKASATFDEQRGYVIFGSHDGNAYICDVHTGETIHVLATESPIYSTPLIHKGRAYITSMDKHLYCIDLSTLKIVWKFETHGRVFSNAVIINNHVYVGSNDGFLYELDIDGNPTGYFPAGERIVNNVLYNAQTDKYFLLTHANELYRLTRRVKKEK